MKLNVLQIIYFCLITYVFTFPNDLFDELWEKNQPEPQANNNSIESQPKIKVESNEEQFDGRWQDESALKGNVKAEHEPHYEAVKVEDGQASNTSDHHKKIGDDDENWSKDEDNSAPSADDFDPENSKKHFSDQNNSTDQDESFDEQQNDLACSVPVPRILNLFLFLCCSEILEQNRTEQEQNRLSWNSKTLLPARQFLIKFMD
uniref:Secreted protein n=1 Tax=Globodera rostochiensis TaxID=31243 RepID=A0A914GSK1_GLORO